VAAVQRVRVPSWAPADDKQGLWSAEDRVLDLLDAQAGTWTLAIEEAVRATGLDPDGTDAPRFLARLWWERWVMARQRGYLGEEQLAAARVRQHDDGTYAPRLDAVGRLTVSSPGRLLRVVRHRRRFTTEHVADTPCEALPLPAGAYQVVYADSGRPPKTPVVASLAVGPHEDVVSPARPPEGPEGFVAVPAGSFPMGGDPDAVDALEPCRPFVDTVWVAVHPVTAGQWLEWMRTLSPAEARAACPAFDLPYLGRQRLWEWLDDGTLRRPDTWADDHPIAGIAVEQAEAYAAWRSEGSDWRFALPTEEQWEKAARGADQRVFPWGTLFDPCLAHTRRSLQGGPHPGPVGAFPSDRSVYGVADLSGGVRELTRTRAMSGGRVVRGGSWADDAQGARLASRHSLPEGRRDLRVGFRLVATPQRSDRAI
jgi:serine/threonine-protein kinase